ncbi:MAG TPA: ATP-binding protein, partial [Pyrinomonadaceae bacterium]|nr:ATP-binding protein [Pyrinomonadaceae bacterium]
DFARTRPPARAPLDVRRALEASIRLASFDKDFKQLTLTTDYDDSAPLVSADTDQLQQVFLNLLLNARDAMPAGGRIRVSTVYQRDTQELSIEIADDGAGIAPEHRAHIFDPFFTTKPAGMGTGLGLAVCYGIITAHGGSIEVASNENGASGTTVRVSLPTSATL